MKSIDSQNLFERKLPKTFLPSQRSDLNRLFWNIDLLSLYEWDLRFTSVLQHEIDTGTEAPVRQPLRRQPLIVPLVIDEQVELMLQQWPQLHDGLLTREWLDAEDNNVRWHQLVPSPVRRISIQLAHEGKTWASGHRRTSAQVKRRAYWPGLREDIQLQLQRHLACAQYVGGKTP